MGRFFFVGLVILLLSNCLTLGKVGYIVPDTNDDKKPGLIKKVQTCELLGTSAFIDALNVELKTQKISELRNVNLGYHTKGCITFLELSED
ncbi:hypothetical protein P3G55_07770 [Leptospira sp. 96542]|nr:hypothetical protein [Leptospira sp. 96542]